MRKSAQGRAIRLDPTVSISNVDGEYIYSSGRLINVNRAPLYTTARADEIISIIFTYRDIILIAPIIKL